MGWEKVTTPEAQVFDLPLIGDDLAKLGRIIHIWANPCSPGPEIWVYALWQAIPTLFITLTKPELVDIDIKKGHHRPRKGRRARFRARHIIRDAIFILPVPSWRVFRLYEWGQKIGWYFLVADALEDFTINWLSLAYKYEGCTAPFLCYAQYTNELVLQGSSLTPTSRRFTWNLDFASLFETSATTATPVIGGNFDVSWECQFTPYQVPELSELPTQTKLIVDNQLVALGDSGQSKPNEEFSSGMARVFVFDSAPYPDFQIHGVWQTASRFCYMTGSWSLSRSEDTELSPDP